ncbi:hypothetical protein SLNWT_3876 [Streptomyces albus]|uniref:Uncharacterized protein n=1 Tax=Streptomyces albus (strain ATCC 21838 / DSM 41398 / FERM P-419 / JCM 4703 / NBRC 107858) TaxID=1081613 RepID=A0A0B5F1P7_STRA4|nr:hypothetical protein SLNWT_3876 [Streptomyces albus]AOU78559.1 hypothetical protein SLNHY_3868 [Streptomyces albus]AYN34302.1 hypothetical protein DUI70_3803 [Streptomyces albus]
MRGGERICGEGGDGSGIGKGRRSRPLRGGSTPLRVRGFAVDFRRLPAAAGGFPVRGGPVPGPPVPGPPVRGSPVPGPPVRGPPVRGLPYEGFRTRASVRGLPYEGFRYEDFRGSGGTGDRTRRVGKEGAGGVPGAGVAAGAGAVLRGQRLQEADHTRPKSMWSRVTSGRLLCMGPVEHRAFGASTMLSGARALTCGG